jgi:post-segregation antitoxin (ccd killing protein)
MGRPRAGVELKQVLAVRVDPELLTAVKQASSNMSRTVEEALRLWLAYERRKAAKVEALAKHIAPASARDVAARTKDGG